MKLSAKSGATVAIAASAMLLSGAVYAPPASAASKPVPCFGTNACKGQGACKTAKNSCKGQNACKGKGLSMKSASACKHHGGKIYS